MRLDIERAADKLAAELRKEIEATIEANLETARQIGRVTKERLTWQDFHHRTDELVQKHAPTVQAAMSQVYEGDTVRHAIRAAYTATKALPTTGAQATNAQLIGAGATITPAAVGTAAALAPAAAGVAGAAAGTGAAVAGAGAATGALGAALAILAAALPATVALSQALHGIYSDAWLAGSHAAGAAGAIMPTGTDAQVASALLSDGGLALLLEERGLWVKEITHTQMERIGDAIAKGVAGGASRRETIDAVEAIIHDPKRAAMIADTETARALAAAAMHRYRESNMERIKWLAHPDCCSRCKVNAHAGPKHDGVIYIWQSWPMGPIPVHPFERCAVAPYHG